MKESRSYQIHNRVFNKQDLSKIADLFDKRSKAITPEGKKKVKTTYQLSFSGGISYESETPAILQRDEILDYKKLLGIDMDFYGGGSKLTLSLSHGNGDYGNSLRVSGEDTSWVNESFTKLKELIDGCTPQANWFINHRTILYHLLAIGIGSIVISIISYVVSFLNIEPSGDNNKFILALEQNPWALYLFMWFSRWVAGIFWVDNVIRWFFALWPNIELDIGPEHLKKEKIAKKRIAIVLSLIVLPIAHSLIQDFLLN